jgi:pimeloyl-ACP methyl ester carboxylesterase
MLGRLVQTNTIDGVRLHGFMTEPARLTNAWILVHGVNSNYYSSSLLLDLSRSLASDDTAVLLVNTRGHDILSFNTGSTPMRLGSQIESISASQLDLDAWVQFLTKEGVRNFSLLGHSLGALKCILWGLKKDERLKALVAVSPPRLSTELLLQDPNRGPVFAGHLKDAMEKCDAGHPESVMKVRFPLPMWVCASTYVDKYGSGEKYDYHALANELGVPTLWTFGQYEVESGSANFKNADSALQERFNSPHQVNAKHTICVIQNADHSYRDVTSQLAERICGWSYELDGAKSFDLSD